MAPHRARYTFRAAWASAFAYAIQARRPLWKGVGDHCCEYMTGGRAVVLGPTGRNFAAGMSGGIAYVWNPTGDFDYFCNMEMVELSLIEGEEENRELHRLVSAHFRHTRPPLAARMLEDWSKYVAKFIKVTPTEYKKYLQGSM